MVVTKAQFRTSLLHRVKEEIEAARPGNAEWDFLTDLEYLLVTGQPYADWARKWVGNARITASLTDVGRGCGSSSEGRESTHAIFEGPWVHRQRK